MIPPRWLLLFLAWTLLFQSLAPALASLPFSPTERSNRIGMDRQTLGTVGMGYGVTGVEHQQYLVDTSQPYAEVIQEAEWVNNALPLITRYDIGLDRLRMFKSQVTSHGPPPVYSPVLSGWYLFDGLGSTRAVVDDSGVGQSEFGYGDAFGIPYQVAANGTRATAGAGFFLNGQQWDGSDVWNSGEGLYFNRARYYQPGLGRFIGKDPFEGEIYEPSTLHRYRYANNNPVNIIDPNGGFDTIIGLLSAFQMNAFTEKQDVARTSAGKKVADEAFKTKMFDVYIIGRMGKFNFRDPANLIGDEHDLRSGFHMFIYIGPKGNKNGAGIRYDVGLNGDDETKKGWPKGDFAAAKAGRRSFGFLQAEGTSLANIESKGGRYPRKIAEFNGMQYAAWALEADILGWEVSEEGEWVGNFIDGLAESGTFESYFGAFGRQIDYLLTDPGDNLNSIIGQDWNCISWTLKAALAAISTSKIRN